MDFSLGNQQGGITVAQETEIVFQGVIVDGFPVAVYKGGNQEQKGALGLVEVGYHHFDYVVMVAGGNDDLGAGFEHIQMMAVKVIQYIL